MTKCAHKKVNNSRVSYMYVKEVTIWCLHIQHNISNSITVIGCDVNYDLENVLVEV